MTHNSNPRFPQAPDLRGVEVVRIVPINDPEQNPNSFDPRSNYAENFWLPILGPSTMWLMRRFADRFDVEADGFDLDLLETSHALGIAGKNGRNNAFHRALSRAVNFQMGETIDDTTLAIRRSMPPLHHGQTRRLPPRLQRKHARTIERLPYQQAEELARAHKLATALLAMGDSPDLTEQQLISWGHGANSAKHAVDQAWKDRAKSWTGAR